FPGQITTMIIPTFTADDLAHLTQTSPTPSQTPTSQSSPVSAPLTLTHNIQYRDSGTDVKQLQTYLKNNKLFTGPITGYFGPLTLHAVKLYQKKYGIPQTGTVGPLTRGRMGR
ncbi:MAG: peptidoglycan-binding domain-containing protein, partial [bacterium]